MKLDILAFGTHPDDVELNGGGTLLKMKEMGLKTGIADLTRGESGSRGTPELRALEAAAASAILGLDVRINLGMEDGFFEDNKENRLKVIQAIRQFRPEIVLASAPKDRHPDHGRSSNMVVEAAWLSGLAKVTTLDQEGRPQEHWRPPGVFCYIQDQFLMPDFVVDISPFFHKKREAIAAFKSQFYNPEADGPETYISSRHFWDRIEARDRDMGHMIGADFGEGFIARGPLRIDDLMAIR